jgi:hypothetical protein
MTHALLQAGAQVPWSAVRRPLNAAAELTCVGATVHLSQLRRLYEQTTDHACGHRKAGAPPALALGGASFGGFSWRVALVCCLEKRQQSCEGEPDAASQPAGASPWRLGLQVAAAPLLGDPLRHAQGPWSRHLGSIGAAKAAAAAAHHCRGNTSDAAPLRADQQAPGAGGAGGGMPAAAYDAVASVCVEVGERVAPADAPEAGARHVVLLREPCAAAWCMRPAAEEQAGGGDEPRGGCGLCRRGTVADALAADGGGGLFAGWQPERWSALAPGGQLQWRCDLRVLTDY